MAYGEFYVERQGWARWPKVLVMCRKRGSMEDGSVSVERRKYVPLRECRAIAIYNMHDEWCGDECSACGHEWYEDEPRFCPHCGARVKDGGDD